MSNRVLIPHTNDHRGGANIQPSPAWWLDEDGFVLMRCACGELAGLNNHAIEANGDVNPSIFHDWGCGWHVFGTLLGWESKRNKKADE